MAQRSIQPMLPARLVMRQRGQIEQRSRIRDSMMSSKMRKFAFFLLFLFIPCVCYALFQPTITGLDRAVSIEEEDGSPSVADVSKVKVSNSSLTDNADGTVSLALLTPASADTTYLKLDSSNDPLTGGLEITGGNFNVASDNFGYASPRTPLKLTSSGVEYYIAGDITMIFGIKVGATWNTTLLNDDGGTGETTITALDETIGNLNVFLVDAYGISGGPGQDTVFVTIVSNQLWGNGSDGLTKEWLDGLAGGSSEADATGLAAYSFSSPTYTFSMPTGWEECADSGTTVWGYPNTLTGTIGTSLNLNYSTDLLTLYGDIDNDITTASIDWEGQIDLGNISGLPLLDYSLQVASNFNYTAGGTVAAVNFFLQHAPSGNSSTSFFGAYGGVQTYNANTIGGITAYYAQSRIGATNTHGGVTGYQASLALAATGSRTVNAYAGFQDSISDESGGGSGTVSAHTSFSTGNLAGKGNWTVTSHYGLYCFDNSASAGTSWGIYNLDRSYLGKVTLANDAVYFTQTDGAEFIDSQGDGYLDLGAGTSVRVEPVLQLEDAVYFTQTDGAEKIDSDADGTLDLYAGTSTNVHSDLFPATDDTYYIGKNDDDAPFAWKGIILKDTSDGKYYRIEVTNGSVVVTDLTD